MTGPLITTLIPTFQRPKFLKRAIQSVLNQTFSNFQVKVFDNHSSDQTSDVVARFSQTDSRVAYYCHPKNIGPEANFAYALTQVDTPYFSFLSDDDIILPSFYEKALALLNQFPQAAFCAGGSIVLTERGVIHSVSCSKRKMGELHEPLNSVLETIQGDFPVWTSILFRKSLVEEVGGLCSDTPFADGLYIFQIAKRFPIVFSPEPCAIFTTHSHAYTPNVKFQKWASAWKEMEEVLSLETKMDEAVNSRVQKYYREAFLEFCLMSFFKSLQVKDWATAHLASRFLNKDKWSILFKLVKLFKPFHFFMNLALKMRLKVLDCKRKKLFSYLNAHLDYFYKLVKFSEINCD